MSARPARMAFLAVVLGALLGAAVGGLSHLSAVSMGDPRPSGGLPATPIPLPTLTSMPQASPSATTTLTPSPSPSPSNSPEGQVWLYAAQVGDSLSGVAIRFGTTTEELLTLNPEYEGNEDLVEIGSQVILPCTPIAAAEDRC